MRLDSLLTARVSDIIKALPMWICGQVSWTFEHLPDISSAGTYRGSFSGSSQCRRQPFSHNNFPGSSSQTTSDPSTASDTPLSEATNRISPVAASTQPPAMPWLGASPKSRCLSARASSSVRNETSASGPLQKNRSAPTMSNPRGNNPRISSAGSVQGQRDRQVILRVIRRSSGELLACFSGEIRVVVEGAEGRGDGEGREEPGGADEPSGGGRGGRKEEGQLGEE
jgi:hypothetical protein